MFSVPGPNAALMALQLSGLPTDRFYFKGFLNPKSGVRKKELDALKSLSATLIFYETARRLKEALSDIEQALGIHVVDRTGLILDIFAQRARTNEGKLQVELAQLQYMLPRIMGKGLSLSRLGGGIGTRGAGETKLELDRRRIRDRIAYIKECINKVKGVRDLHRAGRAKAEVPTVGIVGYTNAGKSTLMNIIGGIHQPTSGKVIIEGKDISSMSEDELAIFRRRNLGIIYQFYNLIPTLTAKENIALVWKLDGRKEDAKKLDEMLENLGLSDRANHLPGQMSGGQQQRVSIGRALINEPAFILADEPTGNLDSKTGNEIMDILKMANQKFSQTILLVTHDEKIALMANRVITIGDGKIVRDEVIK